MSTLPLSGTEQDVTRPLGPASGFDRLVLLGGETDLHDDRAAFVLGERRAPCTRIHGYRLPGHKKSVQAVDRVTYEGHNKNMTTKRRFTVRKQSSGYTNSVKFYVYDNQRKGRVSVHASITRESAQVEADELNIGAMVKDYADDPRPYEVRLAEARAQYMATL